jgi:hypothetical protein
VTVVDVPRENISDGAYRRRGPISLMKALATADDTLLQLYFTQFVVCTHDGFTKLLDKLKQCSSHILNSRGIFGRAKGMD